MPNNLGTLENMAVRSYAFYRASFDCNQGDFVGLFVSWYVVHFFFWQINSIAASVTGDVV